MNSVKILSTFVLGFAASLPVCAEEAVNFTGHWQATGQMTPTKGEPTACKSVELNITHKDNVITIQRYRGQCGYLDSDWGPVPMTVRDGKVFEGDEETGTLEGNVLKTLSADGGVQYAFNLKLDRNAEGKAVLKSYYGVRNLLGAIVIESEGLDQR